MAEFSEHGRGLEMRDGGFLSGICHRSFSEAQQPLEVKCPSGIDAIAVVYRSAGARSGKLKREDAGSGYRS
jgi:hypothetical protein